MIVRLPFFVVMLCEIFYLKKGPEIAASGRRVLQLELSLVVKTWVCLTG